MFLYLKLKSFFPQKNAKQGKQKTHKKEKTNQQPTLEVTI